MRILAFADLHASITSLRKLEESVKKNNPDVIICAGDFTIFEQNIIPVIAKIAAFGRKVLLIHGNHETEELCRSVCQRYENLTFIHKKIIDLNGTFIMGFGGGGFSLVDREFDAFVKKKEKETGAMKKIVLVTHAPPFGTKLDYMYGEHVGNKSIAGFVKGNSNVRLAISGHIHETAGKVDKLGNALLANPGPGGMIINIEDAAAKK